jgi:hypothetical protein
MYRGFQNVGGNVKPGGLACSGGRLSKNIVKFPFNRERERLGFRQAIRWQFTVSGTDSSSSSSSGGSQLFVSLRLHSKPDGETLPLDSVPYVMVSIPIVGFWEISKAVSSLIHTHKP